MNQNDIKRFLSFQKKRNMLNKQIKKKLTKKKKSRIYKYKIKKLNKNFS